MIAVGAVARRRVRLTATSWSVRPNRGYSPKAWAFIATFLPFMYLFVIIVSLIIGGTVQGSPVAPLASELTAIAYSAGAALATGAGAGLRSYVDARRGEK